MSIVKILMRTGVLLACSILQVIGVLVEGMSRLLNQLGEYLVILDGKVKKATFKKKEKKTKVVPT